MSAQKNYAVDTAGDYPQDLQELLQEISRRANHERIVSVMWTPARAREDGFTLDAGYTVVSEYRS